VKLIDVTVEGRYLVIHTDEGPRRQSMKWRGVEQLREKALCLKGKNVRTTTSGTWDPLTWFATIEEAVSAVPSILSSNTLKNIGLAGSDFRSPQLSRPVAQEITATPSETVTVSITELLSKAESGDLDAQFALAQRYDKGQGTSRNLVQAIQWYQSAANKGHKGANRVLSGVSADDESPSDKFAKSVGLVTKIFGPPGTGKTYTLLKYVQEALERDVPPDQIGYFSFTNKATEEAKSRMAMLFPQYDVVTDFPYFQTLHSLANQTLRTRVNLLSEDQALKFDRDVLIDRPLMREGDESSRVVRVKHPILDAASTARAIKQPLTEYLKSTPTSQRWTLNKWLGLKFPLWENPFSQISIAIFLDYVERFEKYKKSLGVIDYADMLERAIEQSSNLPQFELLILDEAQDLTPIQWDMVRVLIARANVTYVAGDDDQAICEAFGARASEFVALQSNQADMVLNESRRVPPAIHSALSPLVNRLNRSFPYRKDKSWIPMQSGPHGEVTYFESEDVLLDFIVQRRPPQKKKSFLVMFPTNASLKKFSDLLRHKAVDHYAANELVGLAASNLRLQTIWGAKGGEADNAALVQTSDMDRKMLDGDPRLEYVAVTRAKEAFYYVAFPNPTATATVAPAKKTTGFYDMDDDVPF
jgi:hypothetical protein